MNTATTQPVRRFLFARDAHLEMLKATAKKLVMVAGYTTSDGRVIPPHQKMVHYDPDKTHAAVASGQGSHSQKKAHAKLSGKAWWQAMSMDEKAIAVMALATDLQDAASQSAAVSGWKKLALQGKNPTPGQWAAFMAQPKLKQGELLALVQEQVGTGHLVSPAKPVEPEKAAAIEAQAAGPAQVAEKPAKAPASGQAAAKAKLGGVQLAPYWPSEVADAVAVMKNGGVLSIPQVKAVTGLAFVDQSRLIHDIDAAFGAGTFAASYEKYFLSHGSHPDAIKGVGAKYVKVVDEKAASSTVHDGQSWKGEVADAAAAIKDGKPLSASQVKAIQAMHNNDVSKLAGELNLSVGAGALSAAMTKYQKAALGESDKKSKLADEIYAAAKKGHTWEWTGEVASAMAALKQSKFLTDSQYKAILNLSEEDRMKFSAELSAIYGPGALAHKLEMHEYYKKNPPPEVFLDGDTKQGADGMLVFKDGRWHKLNDDKPAKPSAAEAKEAAAPAPTPEPEKAPPKITVTPELMAQLGAKEWKHPTTGESRYYLNDLHALYGLKTDHYKTGNISSATVDGQKVSNTHASKLFNALNGKVWITGDGMLHMQGIDALVKDKLMKVIAAKLLAAAQAKPAPAAPPVPEPQQAPSNHAEAHAGLAAMAAGPHYQKVALAKLKGDKAWQALPPDEQHKQAMVLYKQLQTAASLSAALSTAKKALIAGKVPTKAQYDAILDVSPEAWNKFHAAVTEHIAPSHYSDLMAAAKAKHYGVAQPGKTPEPPKADKKKPAKAAVPKAKVTAKPAAQAGGSWSGDVAAAAEAMKSGKVMTDAQYLAVLKLPAADKDKLVAEVEAAAGKGAFTAAIQKYYVSSGESAQKAKAADAEYAKQAKAAVAKPEKTDAELVAEATAAVKAGHLISPEALSAVLSMSEEEQEKWSDAMMAAVGPDEFEDLMNESALLAKEAKNAKPAPINDGPKEGDTKQGADGMLVLKDGRWRKMGVKKPAAPIAKPGVQAMDDWQKVGGQQGSNEGGRYRDKAGVEWYVKFPKDPDAARAEVLAAKLYTLAGASAQDCKFVTRDGKLAIASRWVDLQKVNAKAMRQLDGAREFFAVDAWLGNHDVVGEDFTNIQKGADGKAHRVDAGGSLMFRAQGQKKEFGPTVDAIDTMRDKKYANNAAVFGGMTKGELVASVKHVLAVPDADIRLFCKKFGPGSEADRAKLADTLIQRKDDLRKRYPEAVDPPVYRVPSKPDFSNWHGPGKGLSSKPALNKQNDELAGQIHALGTAQDKAGLKGMQYQPIKDDGSPNGAEQSVGKHPSKHIKGYWQDVQHALETPHVSKAQLAKQQALKTKALHSDTIEDVATLKAAASAVGRYGVLGKLSMQEAQALFPAKEVSFKSSDKLHAALYADQKAALAGLPELQKSAIKDYTGNKYGEINQALLSGTPNNAAKNAAAGVESAAHVLPVGLVLSRKISPDVSPGSNAPTGAVEFLKKLEEAGEGAVLKEFALCSTSLKSSVWNGSVHLRITCADGVRGLYVGRGPNGGGHSKHTSEQEVILPEGTKYILKKIHKKGESFTDKHGEWGAHYSTVVELLALPN